MQYPGAYSLSSIYPIMNESQTTIEITTTADRGTRRVRGYCKLGSDRVGEMTGWDGACM